MVGIANDSVSDGETMGSRAGAVKLTEGGASKPGNLGMDSEFASKIDSFSLETIVDAKLNRFLDQLGGYYPENLHELIMQKVEKPFIGQILRRVGGNQVHASKILGINRNTLRKKIKIYGF